MQGVGYQLYSSRKFGPLHATLRMVAQAGYERVEGFGELLASDQLASGLGEFGLTMPSAHVSLDAIRTTPRALITAAARLGIQQVYVSYLAEDHRPTTSAGWDALGRQFARACQPLLEAGLEIGWHNHDFEFRPCDDGRMPIACLLNADPRLRLELDVAWVIKAGCNPVPWIEHLGDRLAAVHVKDIAPSGACEGEDGWADVGHGTIDWRMLAAAIRRVSAPYWIMEHDNPSDDRRFARRSLSNWRSWQDQP